MKVLLLLLMRWVRDLINLIFGLLYILDCPVNYVISYRKLVELVAMVKVI